MSLAAGFTRQREIAVDSSQPTKKQRTEAAPPSTDHVTGSDELETAFLRIRASLHPSLQDRLDDFLRRRRSPDVVPSIPVKWQNPSDEHMAFAREHWPKLEGWIADLFHSFVAYLKKLDDVQPFEPPLDYDRLVAPSGPSSASFAQMWHYPTLLAAPEEIRFGHSMDAVNPSTRLMNNKFNKGSDKVSVSFDNFPYRLQANRDVEKPYLDHHRLDSRLVRLFDQYCTCLVTSTPASAMVLMGLIPLQNYANMFGEELKRIVFDRDILVFGLPATLLVREGPDGS